MAFDFRGVQFVFPVAATLLLAACANESTNTEPTASTAHAADNQVQIQMANCATPAEGHVHFSLGGAVLRVPGPAIEDAIPDGMRAPLKKEAVRAEVQSRVAKGAGCPERPLQTALLLVKPQLSHPLLEGSIGLLNASPGNITREFADLTSKLRDAPTKNCRELPGELLACVGTETRADKETAVMYVISKDRSSVMNTGGPLSVRCVLEKKAVVGCNLVDQIPGNVTVDVTLNPGTYTSASLAEARQVALGRIENWRL